MKKLIGFLVILLPVFVVSVSATAPPNFTGTWVLDKSKSQNLPRGWQDAESVTMVITQNDKQLTLEPKVTAAAMTGGYGNRGFGGMMGPAAYNLDGSEVTSESDRGKSVTKAAWSKDGTVLELSAKRTFTTPNGEVTSTSTDKLSLSADGKVLTDARHSEGPRGPQDSTLVFNKKE
jgi:hypothetical protein